MEHPISFASLAAREPLEERHNRPHQLPIHAASSYVFDTFAEGEAIFSGEQAGHIYSRFGNPTIDAVANKLARLAIHGSDLSAQAYLTSSGMAAISTLVMGLLRGGDKILTHHGLYGGTTNLFEDLFQPLGIETVIVDLDDLTQITDILQDDATIKLIYFETPTNPTLHCVDIAAITRVARSHGRWTAVDNTFATPYLQQPLVLGADFVIHSTTKYLNGHGTAVGGVVIGQDTGLMQQRILPALKLAGGNSNAFDAWNLHNGLKTLALRIERHCANARRVATFLDAHPRVTHVNHLSLPHHPHHSLALRQMRDMGGIVSFALAGGLPAAQRLLDALSFCTLSPTLGDVDTLVLHPATMSHRNVPPAIRHANGIPDGLLRINVGIEDVEDILKDLHQALDVAGTTG